MKVSEVTIYSCNLIYVVLIQSNVLLLIPCLTKMLMTKLWPTFFYQVEQICLHHPLKDSGAFPGQAVPNVAAALGGCCPVIEGRLCPDRADTFLVYASITIIPCAMGAFSSWGEKSAEELREKKGVKNKCEKLDRGTSCLEMKEDFSGRL